MWGATHGGAAWSRPSSTGLGSGHYTKYIGAAALAADRPYCTFTESPSLCGPVVVPVAQDKGEVMLLLDEGAQVTLVRHETTKRVATGPGRPWMLHLQVVGHQFREIKTKLYDIVLVDAKGQHQALVVAGVDSISSVLPSPDLGAVRSVFPKINESTRVRPAGEVDILVGVCDARHLTFGGIRVGDMRLEASPWGSGEILRGTVPALKLPQQPSLEPAAWQLPGPSSTDQREQQTS